MLLHMAATLQLPPCHCQCKGVSWPYMCSTVLLAVLPIRCIHAWCGASCKCLPCRVPVAELWWQLRLCTGLASATVLEQQQLLPPVVAAFQGAVADSTAEPAGSTRVRVEVPVEVPIDLSPGAAGQQVSVGLQQGGQAGQGNVRVNVDVSELVAAVQAGMQASRAAAALASGEAAGAAAGGAGGRNGTAGGGSGAGGSSGKQPIKKTIKALPRVSSGQPTDKCCCGAHLDTAQMLPCMRAVPCCAYANSTNTSCPTVCMTQLASVARAPLSR